MHRYVRYLEMDEAFLGFQNDLALKIYDGLGQAFSLNDNEVSLVTKLCEITDGESHGPLTIHADKIHGSRSYVEFNYRDKPVTKELGDMAIITIVSKGRERVLQKLCIIQNKKGSKASGGKNRWDIDLEQLYLLKNFPKLSGNKGIFKNCHNISFGNSMGCLGAFGLMHAPGDMIFITAPVLTEMMKGRKSVNSSDISYVESCHWFSRFFGRHFRDDVYKSTHFTRDIYDFVRAWTQTNIGELCYSYDSIINPAVDGFSNALLRRIGFDEVVELPHDRHFAEFKWEGELGIMAVHIDIDKIER